MDGEDFVTVSVDQGVLRGKRKQTASAEKPYCAFLAVPYAKPPVGELRFKPPQPADKWSGVLDATREPEIAPQCNVVIRQYQGHEDCLYLNVYTPVLPCSSTNELVPVMVWIHGGAFTMGSGNSDMYGPDHLLERNVVVVTINYRLGALGFASTGDLVIPGNMGLKDQVMALRWVQDNIKVFGGDPRNVTIFGESAGSMSCHALVLSPMGNGLFCRAILQSGVITGDDVCSRKVAERTFKLADVLGEASSNSEEVAAFLRQVPAETLVEKAADSFSQEDKERMILVPFAPTVEPEEAEGGAFFSRHPLDILTSGDYNQVPIIMGLTSLEGSTFLMGLPGCPTDIDLLNNISLEKLLPRQWPISEADREGVAREVRKYYLHDEPLDQQTITRYLELRADLFFTYPAMQATRLHASKSSPVYFYKFSVDAGFNFVKAMFKLGKVPGAAHGDELCYLFRGSYPGLNAPVADPESVEGKTVARLTKLWTNFAKTGEPTPTLEEELGIIWPAFNTESCTYLDINNEGLSALNEPFKERVAFWDKFFGS